MREGKVSIAMATPRKTFSFFLLENRFAGTWSISFRASPLTPLAFTLAPWVGSTFAKLRFRQASKIRCRSTSKELASLLLWHLMWLTKCFWVLAQWGSIVVFDIGAIHRVNLKLIWKTFNLWQFRATSANYLWRVWLKCLSLKSGVREVNWNPSQSNFIRVRCMKSINYNFLSDSLPQRLIELRRIYVLRWIGSLLAKRGLVDVCCFDCRDEELRISFIIARTSDWKLRRIFSRFA